MVEEYYSSNDDISCSGVALIMKLEIMVFWKQLVIVGKPLRL